MSAILKELSDSNAKRSSNSSVKIDGEEFQRISDYHKLPPFFISIVSATDFWMFVSSRGSLTAGRVSPENALFPYKPDDQIHDSWAHTGPVAIFKIADNTKEYIWRPFEDSVSSKYFITRNLYKNKLGTTLVFEEINEDLQVRYQYKLSIASEFGLVMGCNLSSNSEKKLSVNMLCGYQNILPAGVPRSLQQSSSNLVDAYKLNQVDSKSSLGIYSLYSGITDKPEPLEVLEANIAYQVGLESPTVYTNSDGIRFFLNDSQAQQVNLTKGVRGAYLVHQKYSLAPKGTVDWMLVADVNKSQLSVEEVKEDLIKNKLTCQVIRDSLARTHEDFTKIIARADGLQTTSNNLTDIHHFANVTFNTLRGGTYHNDYKVNRKDFLKTVSKANSQLFRKYIDDINVLNLELDQRIFLQKIEALGDDNLLRLAHEYLPLSFGRRHGDPSRPWNQFEIKLIDGDGNPSLYYQGNWRDIFQNLEALSVSYPGFIDSIISKFVNASTLDGYNPYRITKDGIDWEVEDPDDPWSYIGYWGDHQIIYLLKLLEISSAYFPKNINTLLRKNIFSYANVPYRINSFDKILEDSKNTISFDHDLNKKITSLVEDIGFDGKLVHCINKNVYLVNLAEKLLVPLLTKVGNFVPNGGIWLNTQRPEWNDANNALVGNGLSMVTVYYLRRYIDFLLTIFDCESEKIEITKQVHEWLKSISKIISECCVDHLASLDSAEIFEITKKLGYASEDYRQSVYESFFDEDKSYIDVDEIKEFLQSSKLLVESTILKNKNESGLYESYNTLHITKNNLYVRNLYSMLEGQVGVLSSGLLDPEEVISVVKGLFHSDMYREDQNSFMLYPDKKVTTFLEKNCIPLARSTDTELVKSIRDKTKNSIFIESADSVLRFNHALISSSELHQKLDNNSLSDPEKEFILNCYAETFNHDTYTGRSGGMFGYEGLGSIYWHMVSKLLLAVQENYYSKFDFMSKDQLERLGNYYYMIQSGLGYRKSAQSYGAFPTDPYSHTPKHAGAQQPGMTGQVKEEVLTRFGELGVLVRDGSICFMPTLLKQNEFLDTSHCFEYLSVAGEWQQINLESSSLAFTFCQVPIVYLKSQAKDVGVGIQYSDGVNSRSTQLSLDVDISREIFMRTGLVKQVTVYVPEASLFC